MPSTPLSAEDRIIQAAIDCIEKYGFSGATNRQIAQAAGVNLAAINYYFRSKDVLIERVREITLGNSFDLSNVPAMPGATCPERLTRLMIEIIAGGLNYPGITRAHFYNLLAEGQSDPLLLRHINQFIANLAEDLRGYGCTLPEDELKLALRQVLGAVLMATLAPALFEQEQGFLLHTPAGQEAYVVRLVNKLLG